jgi:hypothetical protein
VNQIYSKFEAFHWHGIKKKNCSVSVQFEGQPYEVEKDRPVADFRGRKGVILELFEAVLLRRIKADLRFPKAGSRLYPRLKSMRQLKPSMVQPSTTILKAYKMKLH